MGLVPANVGTQPSSGPEICPQHICFTTSSVAKDTSAIFARWKWIEANMIADLPERWELLPLSRAVAQGKQFGRKAFHLLSKRRGRLRPRTHK